jgi:hypothetical protein
VLHNKDIPMYIDLASHALYGMDGRDMDIGTSMKDGILTYIYHGLDVLACGRLCCSAYMIPCSLRDALVIRIDSDLLHLLGIHFCTSSLVPSLLSCVKRENH